jgi:hypothetical protein
VADPCLNSYGFRYHIEYSRLMALRVVREEGARKLEHERRPLGTLLTGTRPWNQSPPFAFWGAAVGGRFMIRTKVEEYRQHAQECLQLAGMMTSPEHRAVLVAMAQAWKLLAQFHCLAEPRRIPSQPNLTTAQSGCVDVACVASM